MGKVNLCLKICFIIFTVSIEVFGIMLITGLLRGASLESQSSNVFAWIYAVFTVVSGGLGVYAARKENVLLLKIFAGLISVGLVANLVLGSIVVADRNQIYQTFKDSTKAQRLLEDHDIQYMLKELQKTEKCCGLASASDWGSDIPDSCGCKPGYDSCIDAPTRYGGPQKVYAKTCGMLMVNTLFPMFAIAMGIFFGMAAANLLGLLMSIAMIKQAGQSHTSDRVTRA